MTTLKAGTVYLVGAGPGDPKLITVRGLELLKTADVVVYDRLTHPSLLSHSLSTAEKIYVGKASAHHSMKQPDINAVLVERALQGKSVVRLKGGDPFVFGRGGEEAEYCKEHGICFEIVPGVTSAIAAPAYAGIPVTHRDAASSFSIITGHERDDSRESGTRAAGVAEQRRQWSKIAHAADTLLFLMGVEALPDIAQRLQENGRAPETPVALVQWGTWARQRVVVGTLADIVERVHSANLKPPAVCVVGDVVNLRSTLGWFDNLEQRPLFGKRIVVTRAREQASGLSDLLRTKGADPIELPVIEIRPLEEISAIDDALLSLNEYDWVILTSANAVPAIAKRMNAMNIDGRAFARTKIATIGPATAQALKEQLGLRADFIPTEAVAEAILEQFPETNLTGKHFLIPRALEAREVLPETLRQRGAVVDVIAVYETVMDTEGAETLRAEFQNGEVDIITFTSSSTVRNFVQALTPEDPSKAAEIVKDALIAAIGPITANTAREFGLEPYIVAEEHTIPGLVAAIESYYIKETIHA
ncbi:uroporphyrinogen III methyltransferase [Armatimonadota bacterium]|nr:uroporphyrinogen III methyltransferase [Armatimonadota bacterium]